MVFFKGKEIRASNSSSEMFIQIAEKIGINDVFCLDIGAGDGKSTSNTYDLLKSQKEYKGLLIESLPYLIDDAKKCYNGFDNVKILQVRIDPKNINYILENNNVPEENFLLSLDIDGLDYKVLESVLLHFKPALICMEINEKIPPPIEFYLQYLDDRDFVWDGSHFYGCSIQSSCSVCEKAGYIPIHLEWNNLFLVKKEYQNFFDSKTICELYAEGYLNKIGDIFYDGQGIRSRKEIFSHNLNVEEWLNIEPIKCIEKIKDYFKQYSGLFEILVKE